MSAFVEVTVASDDVRLNDSVIDENRVELGLIVKVELEVVVIDAEEVTMEVVDFRLVAEEF
jgi:hypothetical protein